MKNRKAITMIELMVAFFLLSVLAVPLYYFLTDTTKKANIAVARDDVKREANKILSLVELDVTQAAKPTSEVDAGLKAVVVSGNSYVMQRKKDGAVEKDGKFKYMLSSSKTRESELKYTYTKPELRRSYDGKCWILSNKVDSFDISPSLDNTPGKYVISLVMKSNMVGLKDEEQPVYEQQKIVMCMEEATDPNDPNWREVGDLKRFVQAEGDLLKGLKEDAKQIVQDFAKIWEKTFGDISKMTKAELKSTFSDLKSSLNEVKKNLDDVNKQIKDMDWHALYDESGFLGRLFGANKRKRKNADKVKNLIAGYDKKEKMDWQEVKSIARNDMKEDAIKSMFDAKMQLFDGGKQLVDTMKQVQDQAGEDLGMGQVDVSFLGL